MIQLKRVYEEPTEDDGVRLLVERLWPRGLTKAAAAIDRWERDLAPSPELRRWFAHDPAKWPEFRRRYEHELQAHTEAIEALCTRIRTETVTFVYAARDEEHNSAVVLRDFVRARLD